MLNMLYDMVKRHASPKAIWVTLACFVLSLALINGKPFGVAQLKAMTGGVGILDMEMGYSPQKAYDHLTALGEAGRAFHLHYIVPQDFIFPAIYSIFYVLTTTFLFRKLFAEHHALQKLSLLTLLGGLADYCENLCIVTMLLDYPAQHATLANIANVLTLAKFGGVGLAYLLLLAGVFGVGFNAARERFRRKNL